MAGYAEALEILGHGSARAKSKLDQITPDWKQVIPLEFPEKYVAEGNKHYSNHDKSLAELTGREELYVFQLDRAGVKTELGGTLAALKNSKAEATLLGGVETADILDGHVNKPFPGSPAPRNAEVQLMLTNNLMSLGKFYLERGQFEKAEKQYSRANNVVEGWKQRSPESIRWQEARAEIADGFGDIHLSRKELDKAYNFYDEALKIRTKLSQPDMKRKANAWTCGNGIQARVRGGTGRQKASGAPNARNRNSNAA